MSHRPIAPEHLASLRLRAASRLTGAADAKDAAGGASDALAVLYELASSPATAADALALLHELQVHQVELDLQAEELRDSRIGLESALHRQIERYDRQPVGCFTIDRGLVVHEVNRRGVRMLGIGAEESYGLMLDSFLSPADGHALRAMMADLAQAGPPVGARLRLITKDGTGEEVQARLGADPNGEHFLLVLVPQSPSLD